MLGRNNSYRLKFSGKRIKKISNWMSFDSMSVILLMIGILEFIVNKIFLLMWIRDNKRLFHRVEENHEVLRKLWKSIKGQC